MNVRQFFPSPWISCDDLGNRKFELVIKAVVVEEVHQHATNTKVKKMVVAFQEAKKRFILNKTQAFALARICGSDDTEQWVGKRVVLRAGKAHNQKPTIIVEAPTVPAPALEGQTHE